MSVSCMRALLAGDIEAAEREIGATIPEDLPETLEYLLRYRLGQVEEDPAVIRWLARSIVLPGHAGARNAIGTIGFHGPPDDAGRLEIGYRMEPGYRRQGYTREAVEAMFQWAGEQGINRFIAAIRPDNEASLGLAAGFGFVQTGSQMDDVDGLELVLEAIWPPNVRQ